ncbi:hypothetical protein BH23VER1_BH23VER1_20920 [soil metagenome]
MAPQRKYPQPRSQKPGCGFPALKLVGLLDLASGAWIAFSKCHTRVHESRLFRLLYRHLRAGDTVVTDRGFCAYWTMAELMAKGVDVVMRNHQMRRSDFRTGVRLGRRDHLIVWEKPQRPRWMDGATYAAMPDQIVLRETASKMGRDGFPTTDVILASTFLPVEEKSAQELGEIYLRRWRVELFFDDIKTTMAMGVLRTKSPSMVCRELLMHMIAYNLLRLAVAGSSGDPERTSFKGAADRVHVWAPQIMAA